MAKGRAGGSGGTAGMGDITNEQLNNEIDALRLAIQDATGGDLIDRAFAVNEIRQLRSTARSADRLVSMANEIRRRQQRASVLTGAARDRALGQQEVARIRYVNAIGGISRIGSTQRQFEHMERAGIRIRGANPDTMFLRGQRVNRPAGTTPTPPTPRRDVNRIAARRIQPE